jgi:hypothetical protein
MDPNKSFIGGLPLSAEDLRAIELAPSSTQKLAKGKRLSIVECAQIIREEYRAAQRELEDLAEEFYKTFPTKHGRRGYTLSIRREKDENGAMRPRSIHWRLYFLRAFPKKTASGLRDSLVLKFREKMPAQFEYGKKRFSKLPKSFWKAKEEGGGKGRRPDVLEKFSYFDKRVQSLNNKIDILAKMNLDIRMMVRRIRDNKLFKQTVVRS